jgi:hypothetical protein
MLVVVILACELELGPKQPGQLKCLLSTIQALIRQEAVGLSIRVSEVLLGAHFAFLSAPVTLSHALDAELDTLLEAARADCCRALATSEPLVAAADACINKGYRTSYGR